MDGGFTMRKKPIKHIVYQITHKRTGKIYVGVHSSRNPKTDGYMGSGHAIKNAIEKEGRKAFKKSILHYFPNREEAIKKEIEIVNKAFAQRSDTYNIVVGGSAKDLALEDRFWEYKKIQTWVLTHLKPKGITTVRRFNKYAQGGYKGLPDLPEGIPQALFGYLYETYQDFNAENFFQVSPKQGIDYWKMDKAVKWVVVNLPKVKTQNDWRRYVEGKIYKSVKRPIGIPKAPEIYYKKTGEWIDPQYFFTGKRKKAAPSLKYYTAWVHKNLVPLGIDSPRRFSKYLKGEFIISAKLPEHFPKNPYCFYRKRFNKKGEREWVSWNHFFNK